jgi:hypothetical protein
MVPSAAKPLHDNVLFNPAHRECPALVNANPVLPTTPIDPEDQVVLLAMAARRDRNAW